MDKTYTPEELAKLWKVSTMTIYKLLGQQKIPHFRVGRAYRITQEQLKQYMQSSGIGIKFAPIIPPAAQQFVQLLEKSPAAKRKNIQLVRLFGSYARGTPNADSDIDLLVVAATLDQSIDDWLIHLSERAMALGDYEELLSLLTMSTEHWERNQRLKTPIYESITDEGITLWSTQK